MEEETLTIKTIPYEGEAFSSFLLRTAVRNKIRYEQLLKIAQIKNSRSPHIDLNPKVVTDLRKLSFLLQIDRKYFKGASLENIIETFLDEEDQKANYYRSFILNVFNHTYRCFCSMCLKEKNCYQLLWQIKELKVCDKHGTPLTSQCPSCKQNQPYVHPSLVEVQCYSCGEKLFKQKSSDFVLNTNYYNDQKKKYEIWRTLLTLKTKLNPSGVEDKSKYLTLLLLYYYNQREDDFYMFRLKTLSNDTKSRFLSYIQKGEGYKATLPQILKVIDESGVTLSEFITTELPEKFIDSVRKYQTRFLKTPLCQSPWCGSYQTSNTMIRSNKPAVTWNGVRYLHVHLCSVCFVKYGFIKEENKWAECGESFLRAGDQILPLLIKGEYAKDIATLLNTTQYTVLKYSMYFSSQGILPQRNKEPKKIIEKPIDYFMALNRDNNKSDIARARKMFGWGQKDYFRNFFNPEVQLYMFTMKNEKRSRVNYKKGKFKNKEIAINHNQVRKGISDVAVIRQRAEAYINNQIAKDEIIADIYLYKYLETTKKTVKKLFPELLEWIEEQKQLQKARMNDKVEEERIERIKEAVILITNHGDYPTYENVVEISGVPKKYIRTHKKVSNVFNELKKRYRRK